MKSSYRDQSWWRGGSDGESVGFRVASVPEPSAGVLGALSLLAVLRRKRRTG